MSMKAVVVALLATTAFVASPVQPASAAFSASALGAATASAQTIPQAATPTTSVAGRDVTVSWAPTVASGGTTATSYVVRRYNTSNVAQTVLSACVTVTTNSCVENLVPVGTWTYSVQARIGTWAGAESAKSAQVTVVTPPPALVSLQMRDVNANGKIDQVRAVFDVTLATYTAGLTPWTLANVPSNGTLSAVSVSGTTATLTITEGAGAATPRSEPSPSRSPRTPTASASTSNRLSSFGPTTPTDLAAPVRLTQEMFDDDVDGKIDRALVTFTEALAPFTAPVSAFTLASVPSAGSLATVTTAGTQATLAITEGAGAASTAVGSFTIALATNAAGIRDAAGNLSSYAAGAPIDRAAPALVTLTLLDNDGDAKVDRVTALFSETLQAYSAGTAPFTLANVPSAGTLSSVSLSAATLTLTLTEGAGAADTAVGAMTVAMATNAGGARDAIGNLGSFAARAPLDGARPVPMLITDTNGTVDGQAQPGDSITVEFSEALAPATVPASTTLTLTDPNGGGSDTLTMAGVSNGARSTGGANYVLTNNTSAAFAGSVVGLSNANRSITVTIAATCSGAGCAALGQQTTNATYSFVGATTLTDVAGNLVVTTARTASIRLF